MRGIIDRCPAAVDPRGTHPPAPLAPVAGWLSRRLDHQGALPAGGVPNLRPIVSASFPTAVSGARLVLSNLKGHCLASPLSRDLHSCSAIAQRPARAQRTGARRSQPLGPSRLHEDHSSTAPDRSGRNKDTMSAARDSPLPSRAGRVHRVRLTARCSGRGRCLVRCNVFQS